MRLARSVAAAKSLKAARAALEQFQAQHALDLRETDRQLRLAQPQRFGGAAHVLLARQNGQDFQIAGPQVHSQSRMMSFRFCGFAKDSTLLSCISSDGCAI